MLHPFVSKVPICLILSEVPLWTQGRFFSALTKAAKSHLSFFLGDLIMKSPFTTIIIIIIIVSVVVPRIDRIDFIMLVATCH